VGILRKIKKMVVSSDPDSSNVESMGSNDEIHNFSDTDGSLESIYVEEIRNQACGCFLPPGGRCSECGAISCVKCHRHCGGTEDRHPMGCGKPLCREHAHILTLPSGQTVPFCSECHGKAIRKHRWQRAGRFLLESFVEEESNNE
jgi:hypothetical protein